MQKEKLMRQDNEMPKQKKLECINLTAKWFCQSNLLKKLKNSEQNSQE